MIAYLETSAAVKLLKPEPGSAAVSKYLNELVENNDLVVSSNLLETELRRAATRQGVAQVTVTALLDRVGIFDLPRSTFLQAGLLTGGNLRNLDAIHIAAALRINADVLVSYNQRQLDAAEEAGMHVHSPA